MLLAADPILEIQPNSKACIHLIATLVSCYDLGQSPLFQWSALKVTQLAGFWLPTFSGLLPPKHTIVLIQSC